MKGILSQATAGMPGDPVEGKWFGEALATADLNFFFRPDPSHLVTVVTRALDRARTDQEVP